MAGDSRCVTQLQLRQPPGSAPHNPESPYWGSADPNDATLSRVFLPPAQLPLRAAFQRRFELSQIGSHGFHEFRRGNIFAIVDQSFRRLSERTSVCDMLRSNHDVSWS